MSHPEQLGFIDLCRKYICVHLHRPRVLEIGSYDVNESSGGIRGIFSDSSEYIGVDLISGPGVDVVASGHEVKFDDASFDIVISSECFEHNPHWAETFENMHRMCRSGGIVIMTCATIGRVEHGTTRTNPSLSPGNHLVGWNYYRNLAQSDFDHTFNIHNMFLASHWYVGRSSHDLYFWGCKRGSNVEINLVPSELETLGRKVSRLKDLRVQKKSAKSRLFRAVARAPLLPLSRVLPEHMFQNIAVPYSNAMYRIARSAGLK